jgi:hypothetical protein
MHYALNVAKLCASELYHFENKVVGPQRKIPWQLFTKNTAPCELVRVCIGGDA